MSGLKLTVTSVAFGLQWTSGCSSAVAGGGGSSISPFASAARGRQTASSAIATRARRGTRPVDYKVRASGQAREFACGVAPAIVIASRATMRRMTQLQTRAEATGYAET